MDIFIDKSIYGINVDTVACDNYTGSYNLTKHLLSTGHEKIAFVSEEGIDDVSSIRDRFLGYCDALSEENRSLDIDLIIYKTSYRRKNDKDKVFLKEIIKKINNDKSITALQVSTDVLAVELIKYCHMEGINVPEDISIVGFNDIELARYYGLTTIRQPIHEMAVAATQRLFERIDDPSLEVLNKQYLPDLIERNTSAPPRKRNREHHQNRAPI